MGIGKFHLPPPRYLGLFFITCWTTHGAADTSPLTAARRNEALLQYWQRSRYTKRKFKKFKMADGRHIENNFLVIIQLQIVWFQPNCARENHMTTKITWYIRESTTYGNTGNAGNLLEFNCSSWKFLRNKWMINDWQEWQEWHIKFSCGPVIGNGLTQFINVLC